MEEFERDRQLHEISTQWTMLRRAGEEPIESASPPQSVLIRRYYGAVYRYLLGALRDPHAAEDLAQEFVLRFLQGRFRQADPGRGRFRDYLKTALIHMVNDHHRARRDTPDPLGGLEREPASPGQAEADPGPNFLDVWREEILERSWMALRAAQPTYHAVLRCRVESPEASSAQIAERLTAQLGEPVRADRVRKALQRAQARFSDLLIDEVITSLEDDDGRLAEELSTLNLSRHCRSALERRRSAKP